MKNNQKLFVISLFAIILLALFSGYIYYNFFHETKIIWKTYTNTRYDYAVDYPSNWYINASQAEEDWAQRCDSDCAFSGGDIFLSNYPPPLKNYDDNNPPPKDLYYVGLNIIKIDPNINYDLYISSNNYKNYEKQNVSIKGIDGLRIIRPEGISTLLKVENKMFSFYESGVYPISKKEKAIADNILNSFTIK